jgi:hypothetical protein
LTTFKQVPKMMLRQETTVIAPMHTISTLGTPMISWVKIFCINSQFKN